MGDYVTLPLSVGAQPAEIPRNAYMRPSDNERYGIRSDKSGFNYFDQAATNIDSQMSLAIAERVGLSSTPGDFYPRKDPLRDGILREENDNGLAPSIVKYGKYMGKNLKGGIFLMTIRPDGDALNGLLANAREDLPSTSDASPADMLRQTVWNPADLNTLAYKLQREHFVAHGGASNLFENVDAYLTNFPVRFVGLADIVEAPQTVPSMTHNNFVDSKVKEYYIDVINQGEVDCKNVYDRRIYNGSAIGYWLVRLKLPIDHELSAAEMGDLARYAAVSSLDKPFFQPYSDAPADVHRLAHSFTGPHQFGLPISQSEMFSRKIQELAEDNGFWCYMWVPYSSTSSGDLSADVLKYFKEHVALRDHVFDMAYVCPAVAVQDSTHEGIPDLPKSSLAYVLDQEDMYRRYNQLTNRNLFYAENIRVVVVQGRFLPNSVSIPRSVSDEEKMRLTRSAMLPRPKLANSDFRHELADTPASQNLRKRFVGQDMEERGGVKRRRFGEEEEDRYADMEEPEERRQAFALADLS